jgi:Ca2+-binding EF-hand superfamily protein
MRKTQASIEDTTKTLNQVLQKSGKLLASYFKGLNNKQLSERIRLSFDIYDTSKVSSSSHVLHASSSAYDMSVSFDTYDTSQDGVLQPNELIEALLAFGIDVDDDEVSSFSFMCVMRFSLSLLWVLGPSYFFISLVLGPLNSL